MAEATVNGNGGPVIDARRLGLPALSIIGLIVVVAYGAWGVFGERQRIDAKIDTQFGSLRDDLRGLNLNLESLTEKLAARTLERWTRTDMQLWCLKVQIRNKGFFCPDPFDQSVAIPDPEIKRTLEKRPPRRSP